MRSSKKTSPVWGQEKSARPSAGRMVLNGTDLGSRRFLIAEDLAVANVDDAMRVLGDIVLVGDQDDGVALIVQTIEQRHNFHAGLRVQVAGGLVRQNDGRTVDQGASNGHALPLSAGQ